MKRTFFIMLLLAVTQSLMASYSNGGQFPTDEPVLPEQSEQPGQTRTLVAYFRPRAIPMPLHSVSRN